MDTATKILVIGDPHFQVKNIPEVDEFVEKLEKHIQSETNLDSIIILGDVLHTHERLHTTALNKAYDFVQRVSKYTKTYVLVGNHDMTDNTQFLTDKHWMNAMKKWENVVVVDFPIKETINNIQVTLCPYVFPGRFVEALNHTDNWKSSSCIFAHQEIKGCKMGAIISESGDEWKEEYPLVVSGHIHSNQWVGDNVYYPGSAMQHAFGESTKNIISILEFDEEGSCSYTEIDLQLPRKEIVYLNIDDVNDYKIDTTNKVKLSISGSYEEFKTFKKTEKYKKLTKNGVKVIFKPTKLQILSEKASLSYKEGDFSSILFELIKKEDNDQLEKLYDSFIRKK